MLFQLSSGRLMPPASFCCPTYFGSTKERSSACLNKGDYLPPSKRICFRQYYARALHHQQKSSDKQVISYTDKVMWCGKERTCARPPLGRLGASSRWRTQCSTLRLGCCASSLRADTHKTQELPVSVCGFGAFYELQSQAVAHAMPSPAQSHPILSACHTFYCRFRT